MEETVQTISVEYLACLLCIQDVRVQTPAEITGILTQDYPRLLQYLETNFGIV